MASPSSHEVRMVETSRPNTRPLEEVDDGESSNKRARNHAGTPSFDENDTPDWQDTVWEAQMTEARDEHDRQVPLVQKSLKFHPSEVAPELALHPSHSQFLTEVQEILLLLLQVVCRAPSQFHQIVSCTLQSESSYPDLHIEGNQE